MFSRLTMQTQLLFCILLLNIHGVILNPPKNKPCSSKEIEAITNKYKGRIYETVKKLETKAENDKIAAKAKVSLKLEQFQKTVQHAIALAENEGFDIYQCLNFTLIKSIPTIVQAKLTACIQQLEKDLIALLSCKENAIAAINKCGLKILLPCNEIKKCCETVEKDFEATLEKGFHVIENTFKKCLKAIISFINAEIKKIKVTVHKCSTGFDNTPTEIIYPSTKYKH